MSSAVNPNHLATRIPTKTTMVSGLQLAVSQDPLFASAMMMAERAVSKALCCSISLPCKLPCAIASWVRISFALSASGMNSDIRSDTGLMMPATILAMLMPSTPLD